MIYGIDIPVSVKNSIEDVFVENDNVESVDCYHKEDLDQFQKDLKLENNIKIVVGGNSSGNINNVWTYYGDIDYSYSEDINLYDSQGNILETISRIECNEDSIITANDWVVSLIEKVSWTENDSNLERHLLLFIYCPFSGEPEEYSN